MAENLGPPEYSPFISYDFSRYVIIENRCPIYSDRRVTSYIDENAIYRVFREKFKLQWKQIVVKYPTSKDALRDAARLLERLCKRPVYIEMVSHQLAYLEKLEIELSQLEKDERPYLLNPTTVSISSIPPQLPLEHWGEYLSEFGQGVQIKPVFADGVLVQVFASYRTLVSAMALTVAIHRREMHGFFLTVETLLSRKELYLKSLYRKMNTLCRCLVSKGLPQMSSTTASPACPKSVNESKAKKLRPSNYRVTCFFCGYPNEHHPSEEDISMVDNEDAVKDENKDAVKDENKDAAKYENEDAAKDENGYAAKDENGYAAKDENEDATKDENGDAKCEDDIVAKVAVQLSENEKSLKRKKVDIVEDVEHPEDVERNWILVEENEPFSVDGEWETLSWFEIEETEEPRLEGRESWDSMHHIS